jgi:glycosyltransferase involved in cell wall biosynthesis
VKIPATLEICGYGRLGETVNAIAAQHCQLKFHGLLTPQDCLSFGRSCDVLVNPRPASHGNQNNFSSKLFDYALAGRAILTSKLSGVEDVLGPDAFYFNPHDFGGSLRENLEILANTGRTELDRRGAAIQQRVVSLFSWEKQGARLAKFLTQVCIGQSGTEQVPEALAA